MLSFAIDFVRVRCTVFKIDSTEISEQWTYSGYKLTTRNSLPEALQDTLHDDMCVAAQDCDHVDIEYHSPLDDMWYTKPELDELKNI